MKTRKPTSTSRFFTGAITLTLAFGIWTSAYAETYDLDDDAPGGNGLSWPQAFNNLQIALGAAEQSGGPDLIKVAQGTYKPGPAGQRLESFVLPTELTLEGGYIGWDEPDPDVRDPDLYVTILSGDIDNNDLNSPADHWTDIVGGNSLHVITVIHPIDQNPSLAHTIEVDGFVITAGDADGEDDQGIGGGAYLDNKHLVPIVPGPKFRKCTFTGNRSNEGGGGLAALFMGVSLRDCLVQFNQTTDEAPFHLNGGGGISVFGPLTLVTSQFIGNESVDLGGGVESILPSVIVDCTFLNNVAGTRGGGVWASGAALTNSLFAGNVANGFLGGDGGGGLKVSGGEVYNCTFVDNHAPNKAGGGIRATVAPGPGTTVANSILWANTDAENPGGFGAQVHGVCPTYSCIQDWPCGNGGNTLCPICDQLQNTGDDPRFVDEANGNYRLQRCSPSIDTGNPLDGGVPPCGAPGLIPCDEFDVDDDGIDGEPTPELDLKDRVLDGNYDDIVRVDMGAYEFEDLCPWDLNGDCCVDEDDLAILLAAAGPCPPLPADCPADFDCDGSVGRLDHRELIKNFGPCPAGPDPELCQAPDCDSVTSAAALGGALAQMGFAEVPDYQAHILATSEGEAFVCACVLQVLLEAQP